MFICNTPSSAISISKAEFPVAMPCPFCQTLLTAASNINEDELALLQNLPYVTAYPIKKTLEENTPKCNLPYVRLCKYREILNKKK